ncbi:MAG: DeoR/GlpR transcriptional regulator [Spirochaetaceae bacterium]|nr:DeoR/GlpR transcriptional regulator [Spirochaetaceae bacterium]
MEKQYQAERYLLIMDIIRSEKTVQVENLALRLNVSENTIRRDLNILAEKKMLRRTKGGAISIMEDLSESTFKERKDKNSDSKEKIAHKAASFINKGDTIILDGGTTSIRLAEKIRAMEHVTVLTNSLDIANILSETKGITLVLSGGILNRDSRTVTGIPAEKFFSEINADKLFLAVTALSAEEGLSDQNMYETPVKMKMIERAREVIVLADNTKFSKRAFSPIGDLTIADRIITDREPEKGYRKQIEEKGVELIVCLTNG